MTAENETTDPTGRAWIELDIRTGRLSCYAVFIHLLHPMIYKNFY